MNDFIQINKFAELNDDKFIIFCKTDYLNSAFEKIKKLDNDVILITGNSDYGIYNSGPFLTIKDLNNNLLLKTHLNDLPKNIKFWFAQNNLTNLDFIISLPMGLENHKECSIPNHGKGWDHAIEKIEILESNIDRAPFKNIYLNCNIETNYNYRKQIKDFCESINIDVEQKQLNYKDFIDKSKEYKAIICPSGNGLDTHRLYEVLAIKRIPILIKCGEYPIYENLFSKLPCVILDNINEIYEDKISNLIEDKINNFDESICSFSYWKNFILEKKNRIVHKIQEV